MNNLIDKEKKSSIYFKLYELFTERLGIKFTPIRLRHFSKVPADSGWTDPEYDPTPIAWTKYTGNIGIIPGRSELLIIDCDTAETIKFFIELANRISLPTETLVVKTRRGAHYYYYCGFSNELEKKQFTNASQNIKIDVLAGNKCQVVAPFSQLKIDKEGQILDYKAQDYFLFIYEPLNIPEKLVEISKDTYKILIAELEKNLLQTKERPTTPQTFKRQGEKRELNDEEIEKLTEVVAKYFQEGRRQNLLLYTVGFLRKELNISEESIYRLYERLQTIDDPKDRQGRLGAIKKTYEKSLKIISGKKQLIRVLGEETANELCDRIIQALGIQKAEPKKKKDDEILSEEFLEQLYEEMQNEEEPQTTPEEKEFVYVEIHRKSRKFARCNYRDLVIEYGAFEKNEFLDKHVYVVHQKVFDCCIDKIYAIENPLTNEKKYEIHFISRNPEESHREIKGSLQEIWEEMKLKTSYILNSSVALNVLTAVFSHFLKQGWYEKKREDFPPGFYYIDNQLINSKFEEKTFTKEDLQKAALLLNEYIYSHPNPQLIASIVKAGLLLPFSFAQKQAVNQGKLRKRIKYIYLYGESRSGKTTTALLLSRIWGTDYKTNYASFCTEARAGKLLSTSTHILIIDEVNKDLETNPVKELLKFAYEDLTARTIQSKTLKQIHYLALAGIIMTSNSHFPEDPALLQRFWIFRFKKADKISTSARNKYEKEDFRCLEALGQFVWNYIKQHGLKDDYINYTVEILKAFYKEAEVNAEWLDWKFKDDTSQTEEEQLYNKEAEFFTAVQKFFNQHIKPRENIQYGKLIHEALKLGQFGRWIWVDDKKFVYLSKDFLLELKKSYKCNIRDLEELSELTGWQKKQKRYKDTKIYVVSTTITEFLYKLNYIPTLLDSYEFDLWLGNKLVIQPLPEEEDPNEETPF